jgi:Flp pilus assembly protein TadG
MEDSKIMSRLISVVTRWLWSTNDGVIAVETALVASFILIPCFLGLWDVGQIALGKAQLDEALADTLTYVAAGNAGNSAGITAAAQASYGTAVTVVTSAVCYCDNTAATSPTAPSSISCTGSCSSGQFEQFLSVTVSRSVTLLFTLPYLTSPRTLSATGQVRTA